jgi:hypothetical protein
MEIRARGMSIAHLIHEQVKSLERRALEALALEEFRLGRLTRPEVRELLGFATRGELDAFLVSHGFFGSFTQADLERDRQDLQRPGC